MLKALRGMVAVLVPADAAWRSRDSLYLILLAPQPGRATVPLISVQVEVIPKVSAVGDWTGAMVLVLAVTRGGQRCLELVGHPRLPAFQAKPRGTGLPTLREAAPRTIRILQPRRAGEGV